MEEELEEITEDQAKSRVAHLLPYQYKKGQSGNPKGRPEGISLKEYARVKFRTMNEEEREDFFNGMNKKDLWEMAEGKAESKTDITTNGKELFAVDRENKSRVDELLAEYARPKEEDQEAKG